MEMRVISSCPLCKEKSATPWLSAGGFRLVQCVSCAHRYSTAALSGSTLAESYYNEDEAALSEKASLAKRARFRDYLRLLGDVPSGASVLDVGCNTGELLSLFQAEGFRVHGIEVSPGPAAFARKRLNAEVWVGPVETALPAGRQFDVITLTHVLEHLEDPVGQLKRLSEALKPGGRLLVEVPNADDLLLSVWRGAYRPLCPGDHISFFSPLSLKEAMRRAGLGVHGLESPSSARDIFFPSLLSCVDLLRRKQANASGGGVMAQTRYRGGRRQQLRDSLDNLVSKLDPLVWSFTRLNPKRGAVLIAIGKRMEA